MRKTVLVGMSVVLATSLFTGCAVKTGNDKLQSVTEQNIDSFIVNGVSTKKDVQSNINQAFQTASLLLAYGLVIKTHLEMYYSSKS